MAHSTKTFINLYHRDLNRLSNELEAISGKNLWEASPGIINSCGVLAQHLTGNLNHFIGTILGNTGFERNREREFSNTGVSVKELINQIKEVKDVIENVISSLNQEDLEADYPNDFPKNATINEALIHLYGHLNYHLGQLNYLRRMIEEKG
jgi:uncharacterized damage-inducible protein DinB